MLHWNMHMPELSSNKRVRFDYEILDEYEAGISLFGFEVKSAKDHRMNLAGSFVVLRNEACPHTKRHGRCGVGAWLLNASIPPYQAKNTPSGYDPLRSRRLLLHKAELKELIGASAQKGLTIVPIRAYTKQGKIKIVIALARHKKAKDKRETIRKREAEREISRTLKKEENPPHRYFS